jgi:hypothetical protein
MAVNLLKAPAALSGGGMFWAITYSVLSVAITLFNKAVFASGFPSAMTLTLLQGVVTIVGCEALKYSGSPQLQYPNLNLRTLLQVAPLSFVFIAYVVISLVSLGRINLPMFTTLRRLTILFVMVEEYFLLGRTPSRAILNTVGVMTLGAAIAAWKDLTFDPYTYFLLFLTNLFTSLYTVYISKVRKDTGLTPAGMLFYSNVSSMPVLLLLALYSGDVTAALGYEGYNDIPFLINFIASIFIAFLMNVSVFYNTSVSSARTQTVVGQLKNFIAFVLGLWLFNDYVYDPINMLGLWVGLAGSVWYAYVEMVEKESASQALPTTVVSVNNNNNGNNVVNSNSNNNTGGGVAMISQESSKGIAETQPFLSVGAGDEGGAAGDRKRRNAAGSD